MLDGRPNGELLLATGAMEDDNPADCLIVQVRRPMHDYQPCILVKSVPCLFVELQTKSSELVVRSVLKS